MRKKKMKIFNKKNLLLSSAVVAGMLLVSDVNSATFTVYAAEQQSSVGQASQAVKAGNSLTQEQIQQANKYIKIENNQYMLDTSNKSCTLSPETIHKIQEALTLFNKTVRENNVVLLSNEDVENNNLDQEVSPFITFVKGKKRKHRKSHGYIVGYGSNGYCYKDSKGNFHYYVTKSPLQTVLDVNRQGLESTLGGGWVQAPENAHWHGFEYHR